MATSKTLTPTNVTIQIPAFTDKPDQRLNSNCIDKEADAINALADQIAIKNLGTAGNQSALESALATCIGQMTDNNTQNFKIQLTAEFGFFKSNIYTGRIDRVTSSRAYVELKSGNMVIANGNYISSAWEWYSTSEKIGTFQEFNYPDISAASDAATVEAALSDILTHMTNGTVIARVMRSQAYLLVCYGAVRNGIAFCNCFNTYNGTMYVFSKEPGQSIATIKTFS